MSYNGIGLSTARGSGTNGYIQKNYTKNTETNYSKRLKNKQDDFKKNQIINSFKDKELIKHDLKRSIDLKVSEYRDKLEDQEDQEDPELDDAEIDTKCKKYRDELIKEFNVKQGYKSRRSREDEEKEKEQDVDY